MEAGPRRGGGAAVPQHSEGRGDRGRLSERAVDRVVRNACTGIEGEIRFSAHSLRAGLVTTLASQGRTELEIMEQTRHKSTAMVRSYARTVDAKRASPLHGAW